MAIATLDKTDMLTRDAVTQQLEWVIEGSRVTLGGDVDSWLEAEAAEEAIMHAPGVTEVDNRIRVTPQLVPLPLPEPEFC